jgi:hypothetical protein
VDLGIEIRGKEKEKNKEIFNKKMKFNGNC